MSRTFTLAEAQMMLPLLESLLRRAQTSAGRASALEAEMQMLTQRIFLSGGLLVRVGEAARRRAELEKAAHESRNSLSEIQEIGVKVTDLEAGLLDFPCLLEGQSVLLCWKLGEKEIGFWHTEAEGFADRKPLDARFGRVERERPN